MAIEPQNPGGNAANVSSSVSRNRPHIQTTSDEMAGKPADAPPPAIAPFDANQATAYQEAWAKHLGTKVEMENSLGMKLRLIPPGEFMMGSPQAEIDELVKSTSEPRWQDAFRGEGPRHLLQLTKAIYLSNCEVTQQQYLELMGANPSHFSLDAPGEDVVRNLNTDQHPVENVSWFDAIDFCNKLSEKEERLPYYLHDGEVVRILGGIGYRLPTEAEWEFACRAGTTTRWSFGDDETTLAKHGWFRSNASSRTHQVGGLRTNHFGLFDIYGNVWEWCWDWHGSYDAGAARDPIGPATGSGRVVHGGAFTRSASECRSASRPGHPPSSRFVATGIRVCRDH
jgi:formylglycine-generating enzyme required for sulfatase activity